MKIEKEIEMTVDIDLSENDIDTWMQEAIGDVDLLFTEEAQEKFKPIKAKYYEKWMEIYWFLKRPSSELKGEDPVPAETREFCKKFFG